jgi:hypothetical protein
MVYNFTWFSQAISGRTGIMTSMVWGWMEIPDVTMISKAVNLYFLSNGLVWHHACDILPHSISHHISIQTIVVEGMGYSWVHFLICSDITKKFLCHSRCPVGALFGWSGEDTWKYVLISTNHVWHIYSQIGFVGFSPSCLQLFYIQGELCNLM